MYGPQIGRRGLAAIGALFVFAVIVSGALAALDEYQHPRPPENSNQVWMSNIGLLGQHELRHIEQTNGSTGNVTGSFFLGIGSVSGNLTAERKLQFYWGRSPDEIIPSALPYGMFRFVIDETKTTPTAEFVYDAGFLLTRRYDHSPSEKLNLNTWIDDWMIQRGLLRVVVVRIAKQTLEKEIYLPK